VPGPVETLSTPLVRIPARMPGWTQQDRRGRLWGLGGSHGRPCDERFAARSLSATQGTAQNLLALASRIDVGARKASPCERQIECLSTSIPLTGVAAGRGVLGDTQAGRALLTKRPPRRDLSSRASLSGANLPWTRPSAVPPLGLLQFSQSVGRQHNLNVRWLMAAADSSSLIRTASSSWRKVVHRQ
jgi:hypothetical protein